MAEEERLAEGAEEVSGRVMPGQYTVPMAAEKERRLDPAEIAGMFSYDPETGWITANHDTLGGRWKAGRRVGKAHSSGYRTLTIQGAQLYEHRVVWVLMTGSWPVDQVDHINRVRDDNRWANLRAATRTDNQRNQPVRKDNRAGIRGVCEVEPGQWRARIKVAGRFIYLGRHPTPESASAAYEAAAMEHFGTFGPRGTPRFGGRVKGRRK